ncbi:MAG: hypothetical protein KKC84_04695 [Candidatus Omnitrophica bacterium]|nr:hypothetical protein [Candidatus Omnitrophota bacterium]
MKINWWIIVIVIVVAIGSSGILGCATSNRDSKLGNATLLEPQAILKFTDIPIPVGFIPLYKDSYSFESSGVRVGVLRYQGKADVEQVVNFYKEQMPMYNWNLLNIVEYGERILNLDRDNETCIISISPKGKSVTMTITVGPKSQSFKRMQTSSSGSSKVDKPVK